MDQEKKGFKSMTIQEEIKSLRDRLDEIEVESKEAYAQGRYKGMQEAFEIVTKYAVKKQGLLSKDIPISVWLFNAAKLIQGKLFPSQDGIKYVEEGL